MVRGFVSAKCGGLALETMAARGTPDVVHEVSLRQEAVFEMTARLLLIALAVSLRAATSAFRGDSQRLAPRLLACMIGSGAAWIATAAMGAWAPWWPILLGPAVGLLERWRSRLLLPVADVAVVLVSATISLPPLPLLQAVSGGAIAGIIGLALDQCFLRVNRPFRTIMTLVPSAVVVMLILKDTRAFSRLVPAPGPAFARAALTLPHLGERIELRTGAIAWLDNPGSSGRHPGALLFHGAHKEGAHQPAACILRRALVASGFIVLAVDHPGYGASLCPAVDGVIEAWDPLPTALAALERLRALDVSGVIAIGHSMGASDVLRLLGAGAQLEGAVLFGASARDDRARDLYWFQRFHRDRRLQTGIPFARFIEILDRYYDNVKLAEKIARGHAPLLFVRFGMEFEAIARSRDLLYEAIPEPKELWDWPGATHYFSAYGGHGVIVGDHGIACRLAERLRQHGATLGLLPRGDVR